MIKKKLLALVAVVMSLCTFVDVGASSPVSGIIEPPTTSWVSGDADSEQLSEYIDAFKSYMGNHFDEESFFIVQAGFSEDKWSLIGNTGSIYELIITIETNSTEKLELAVAQYFDSEKLLEGLRPYVPKEKGYYGYDENRSTSVNDNNTFTVSADTTLEVPQATITASAGSVLLFNMANFGFQVLNEEVLEEGTTIAIDFDAVNIRKKETINLTSITYTFTGTEWVTATDAGYYLVGDTQYGVVRFLFKSNIEGEITESGIKYIKGSNITDYVDGETAAIKGGTGTASAFYGDITDIPDGDTGTYYAVAYVTTDDGQTHWSDVVSCTPDFTNRIDYGGASE